VASVYSAQGQCTTGFAACIRTVCGPDIRTVLYICIDMTLFRISGRYHSNFVGRMRAGCAPDIDIELIDANGPSTGGRKVVEAVALINRHSGQLLTARLFLGSRFSFLGGPGDLDSCTGQIGRLHTGRQGPAACVRCHQPTASQPRCIAA
jgi:hypothetical protein